MKILVTGATGFIGKALVKELISSNINVLVSVRSANNSIPAGVEKANINDLFEFETPALLSEVDVVIHCASRAHILREDVIAPLFEFRQVNAVGTLNLAKQSVAAGVKRFVFISSVGVIGQENINGKSFIETDKLNPQGAYALSKCEAELALHELAKETGLEVVVIRPPLVYGPDAPGNFSKLMSWVSKNIWLPLGKIQNKRSFVYVENLIDFIIMCSKNPNAKNQTFLVSDDEDMSTTELIIRISNALGTPPRLLPVSQSLLIAFLNILGKNNLALRLCGSLQVDISKAKNMLNWVPPVSVDEGLRKTAKYFIENN